MSTIVHDLANAASVRRSKPRNLHAPNVIVPLDHGTARPGQFAVPGWSDDATRRWLDGASSAWTKA
jgi:hypothetical protein